MTEERIAELEAVLNEKLRAEDRRQAYRSEVARSSTATFRVGEPLEPAIAAAERAVLAARAQFQREQREDTDALSREMLKTSKDAAEASSVAARWAKWAAIFTLLAALVSGAIQVWQGWSTRQPSPSQAQTAPAKP